MLQTDPRHSNSHHGRPHPTNLAQIRPLSLNSLLRGFRIRRALGKTFLRLLSILQSTTLLLNLRIKGRQIK